MRYDAVHLSNNLLLIRYGKASNVLDATWAPLLGPLNNIPDVRIPRSLRARSVNKSRLNVTLSEAATPNGRYFPLHLLHFI